MQDKLHQLPSFSHNFGVLIARLIVVGIVLCSQSLYAGIGFNLWAYTDSNLQYPRYDCEGDGLHSFVYMDSGVQKMGSMSSQGQCTFSLNIGAMHRDFHLQVINSKQQQIQNVLYKINTVSGGIAGHPVLQQSAQFIQTKHLPIVMNYGVSHAAPPLMDQAYIYTGQQNSQWMGNLINTYPALQIRDLVLPAAHDAGMYEMNVQDTTQAISQMCASNPVLESICKAAGNLGVQVLENLSITQKDNALQQLSFGTRFFDFRPAYLIGTAVNETYHVHNFIAGVAFKDFLQNVNRFLENNPNEMAFIQITRSGIDEKQFQALSKQQVEQFLSQNVSSQVGYELTQSIKNYHNKTLKEVLQGGQRLVVIFGKTHVNDSYSSSAYSQSLTDPSAVIGELNKTVNQVSANDQYTVLQLQNTGSGALLHYQDEILKNITAWANDLLLSGTGNILQATKPIFDNSTYNWLLQKSTLSALNQQQAPVILLNDFVDTALVARAIGLSKNRYLSRNH